MKISNEKTEDRQAFLTIELEPAEMEASLEDSYKRLVKKTRIPGFRKGKAPRALLERYIGKESLLEETLNNLVPEAYEKAVKEQEIEAYAQPQIEITQTDPLVFKAIVPLKPEVELGSCQDIKIKPEPVKIKEDDIDEVIEQLRHQHATWEPVERNVEFGDMVVLDVEGRAEDNTFIDQKGAQYQLLHDQTWPAPGFVEQLVGMKKDEEKEFQLQLPEDYPWKELAGKNSIFKVKITEIKQEILPELNDEFAQMVNQDFKTVSKLQEEARAELQRRAEERAKADFEEKVLDAVVDRAHVEFPPILVEAEINHILAQRFQGGNRELERYLANTGKTEEELREEIRPLATKRVTQSLVLGKVVEEKNIEVSHSEIDAEIDNIIKGTADNKEGVARVLSTPQAHQSIEQTLITRKAVQQLIETVGDKKKIKTGEEEVK